MRFKSSVLLFVVVVAMSGFTFAQKTTAESMRAGLNNVDQQILDMAKDFPEDKYEFKLKPEMRSFREVLIHLAGGNVFAVKRAKDPAAQWGELDPKDYPNKAAVVAMLEKSLGESEALLKSVPDESLSKSISPWFAVMEHNAEHYGLLVAYYRANGLVPPASRPKPGKLGGRVRLLNISSPSTSLSLRGTVGPVAC